jgi:hypothetical protein
MVSHWLAIEQSNRPPLQPMHNNFVVFMLYGTQ